MKIYSESIMTLPRARYIVERNGAVKAFGSVLNAYSSLNMTRKRIQQAVIQQNWQRSLAK